MFKSEDSADGLSAGGGSTAQCWDTEDLLESVSNGDQYAAETTPLDWQSVVEATVVQSAAGATSRAAQGALSDVLSEPIVASRFYGPLKRLLDIVGGLAGLVLSAPLLLLVGLAVKLTDRGPVLYRHARVGRRGQEFTCYKIRTMVLGADQMKSEVAPWNHHDDDRTFKLASDPRLTPLGKFLRRASIDEIPQLWNVVKGEMSLVGPRPPIPEEVERYTPEDKKRLLVKPGLTCIWQVSGRSELSFPIQRRLDLIYIKRRSLRFDLKLILLTVPAVLSRRGAY